MHLPPRNRPFLFRTSCPRQYSDSFQLSSRFKPAHKLPGACGARYVVDLCTPSSGFDYAVDRAAGLAFVGLLFSAGEMKSLEFTQPLKAFRLLQRLHVSGSWRGSATHSETARRTTSGSRLQISFTRTASTLCLGCHIQTEVLLLAGVH